MSQNKSIFILLPDGVGLRNFAYTSFPAIGAQQGWDITYWNKTPFDLEQLGLKEVRLEGRAAGKSDLYKRARKEIELDNFIGQYDDTIYNAYRFKPSNKGFKNKVKNRLVRKLSKRYKGNKLYQLREKIKQSERSTKYYENCKEQLEKARPDIVFCTNQRPLQAIAPLLAAQDLGIPTATFIFSWDNIPKATMVVETDYYFVWSELMHKQLLEYYPYVNKEQIIITGSPQFEPHFDKHLLQSREQFLKVHSLPDDFEYMCFSGDDVTTSPHDPIYLDHLATTIKKRNETNAPLAIIFRRCPVDFSSRFDAVLEKHKDIIFSISPAWKKRGGAWNTVLPLKEDMALLANTVAHTRFAVNLGSSVAFDYVCQGKPCLYINYNPKGIELKKDVHKVYQYVHFRSMPSKEAVLWVDSKKDFIVKIDCALQSSEETVVNAQYWFETINTMPVRDASLRVWDALKSLTSKKV